jgi:uncharacterized membrane protein YfcA
MLRYQMVPDFIGGSTALLTTLAGGWCLARYSLRCPACRSRWRAGVLLLAISAAAGAANAVLFGSHFSREIFGPGLAITSAAAFRLLYKTRAPSAGRGASRKIRQPTPYHLFWRWFYGYQAVCTHRSHRLHLPCFRWRTCDGYCGSHNASCWERCP